MTFVLSQSNYGKSAIRLVKVVRDEGRHELTDVTVDVMLDGDFRAAHDEGDNSALIATDTMRNAVYALAAKHDVSGLETFGRALVEHFVVTGPTVQRAQVRLVAHPWARLGEHEHAFWAGSIVNAEHNHVLHAMHEVPAWVPLAPTVVAVLGIGLAYFMYMVAPALPARLAQTFSARPQLVWRQPAIPAEGREQATEPDPGGLYGFLLKKWYFDELYDRIFVRPARRLAAVFWHVGDERIIDGMPNGAADLAVEAARGAVRIQTGRVANYAFAMIIGLVFFVSLFMLGLR